MWPESTRRVPFVGHAQGCVHHPLRDDEWLQTTHEGSSGREFVVLLFSALLVASHPKSALFSSVCRRRCSSSSVECTEFREHSSVGRTYVHQIHAVERKFRTPALIFRVLYYVWYCMLQGRAYFSALKNLCTKCGHSRPLLRAAPRHQRPVPPARLSMCIGAPARAPQKSPTHKETRFRCFHVSTGPFLFLSTKFPENRKMYRATLPKATRPFITSEKRTLVVTTRQMQ